MNELPTLTDDAVIELAREGGVAFIPRLSGLRRIILAQLNETQRQRIVNILQQTLPVAKPPGETDSPGRGDQRYYRIQITWTHHNSAHYADVIVLVPETKAPPELEELWRRGEDCVCD
ncbi:protealysin inhibitor emfourin [Franconibacter helveticus]|uniref:protealysin inhibitor emfourin n=1 Tax=Franconibacter helveticus TaxID=357240 RepID=UPI000DA15399|nr:protealysin inhibitor emfourin [Franconibacter helveticus]MDU6925949.1 protealysin inhibitor emfourin [Franconibacter helveticus]